MSGPLYRAVAIDDRRVWCSKWRPDLERTQAQAIGWGIERDDPFDHVWIEALSGGEIRTVMQLHIFKDDIDDDTNHNGIEDTG